MEKKSTYRKNRERMIQEEKAIIEEKIRLMGYDERVIRTVIVSMSHRDSYGEWAAVSSVLSLLRIFDEHNEYKSTKKKELKK